MPESLQNLFMHRCIQLAQLGHGMVAPNPMVGCVLVYEDKIISEGFHQYFGGAHAEVNAIKNISDSILSECTLYVNLEPCSHFGKTPPCADLIIAKKIKKVVIGSLDPYSEVAGKGIEKLRAAGVEVILDVCRDHCLELNKRFFTSIEKKRPFVILKYAQTADEYIGLDPTSSEFISRQISNEYAQIITHRWRSEESAILVGNTTAMLDNPQLNTRLYGGKNPVRVVFDRNLTIPTTHHLLAPTQRTIIFNASESTASTSNIQYQKINFDNPYFLTQMLEVLLSHGIQSLMVEGGAKTLQSFFDSNLWDEARVFTSTKIWGKGVKAPKISSNARMISKKKIALDTLTIYKNTDTK